MLKIIGLLVVLLMGSSLVHAENQLDYQDDTDSYVSVDVGKVQPFATNKKVGSSREVRMALGYRMSDHLAIEGAYIQMGLQFTDISALSISLFGKTPLDQESRYSAYGRFGYASSKVTIVNAGSNRHGDLTYGVGLEFSLNKENDLRRDWYARIGIDRYNTGSLSIIIPGVFVPKDYVINYSVSLLYNY